MSDQTFYFTGDGAACTGAPSRMRSGAPGYNVRFTNADGANFDRDEVAKLHAAIGAWLDETAPQPEPEPTFRVGDRVRIIGTGVGAWKGEGETWHSAKIGSVGEVVKLGSAYYSSDYRVDLGDGYLYEVAARHLEPAPAVPTAPSFAAGDRVVIAAGVTRSRVGSLVTPGEPGKIGSIAETLDHAGIYLDRGPYVSVNLTDLEPAPAEPEPDYGSMVFIGPDGFQDGVNSAPYSQCAEAGGCFLGFCLARDIDPDDFHPIPDPEPTARFAVGDKVRVTDVEGYHFLVRGSVAEITDVYTSYGEALYVVTGTSMNHGRSTTQTVLDEHIEPLPTEPSPRPIQVGDRVILIRDSISEGSGRTIPKGTLGTASSDWKDGTFGIRRDDEDGANLPQTADLVAFEPLTDPKVGDRVVITSKPFYRLYGSRKVDNALDWHVPGAVGVLLKGPDQDGDVRVGKDGVENDYGYLLAPDCLGRILS